MYRHCMHERDVCVLMMMCAVCLRVRASLSPTKAPLLSYYTYILNLASVMCAIMLLICVHLQVCAKLAATSELWPVAEAELLPMFIYKRCLIAP
jgi:hypothetical protein